MADNTQQVEQISQRPESASEFPVTPVCMLLISVSVIIKAWAVFGSWFYEDDFEFLSIVALRENDLEWYFTRHNVHFMPLSLLLVTPVGLLGDFAWWAAALEITLLFAGGAFACWWMLRRVFGSNPRIIAPLIFLLFSPLLIPAVTWWAAAINLVAVQAPLFVLIGSHVEYLRTRRKRWLALATLMLMLVAGVYVKALIVTAVLGLFTACYAVEGRSPVRRMWVAFSRWWKIWLAYAVVGAMTIAVYVLQGSSESSPGERPDYSGMFENLVLRNLVPGLVGGPWRWADLGGFPRQLAHPTDFAVAVALTLVVGTTAYAVHRWHNAWLSLVFLAPAVLATFVSMSTFRTGSFPLLSLELRYWADILPYLVLALGVTAMPIPGFPEVRRRRATDSVAIPGYVVVGLGIAYIASCLTTTMSYVQPWHTDFPARQFVTGAIAQADELGPEIEVANVPAPGSVMSGSFYPGNAPNRLFAPAPGHIVGVEAGADLKMLDVWGRPEPARATGDMEIDVSSSPCITGSDRLELPSATFDFPFWVTVTATFDRSTSLNVSAGTSRHRVDVASGRHDITFRSTGGSFDEIWLRTDDEATACPESVRIGTELEAP